MVIYETSTILNQLTVKSHNTFYKKIDLRKANL